VVDVPESPLNRPKEGQKAYDSGKKCHTLKTPVLIERNSLEIIDVQESEGSEHVFKVYKVTIGKGISHSIPLDAVGYRGIKQYHANRFIPVKSSKKHQLTEEERSFGEAYGH
jgi:hypothetical protein